MIGYFVGLGGMFIFCDGLASLWAYLPSKRETWRRNHGLRLVRCLFGIGFMCAGGILI